MVPDALANREMPLLPLLISNGSDEEPMLALVTESVTLGEVIAVIGVAPPVAATMLPPLFDRLKLTSPCNGVGDP